MEVSPMNKQEKQRARELTMGCWWPDLANGLKSPSWGGIADELLTLALSERQRGDMDRALEASDLADAAADMI